MLKFAGPSSSVGREPLALENAVAGTLNFTLSVDGQSEWYIHNPEPGIIERAPQSNPRRVPVYNARLQYPELSIEQAGFQLGRHQSNGVDFGDDEIIRSHYYLEMEKLVGRITGASRILAFDHNIRSNSVTAETPVLRKPSEWVHADYTRDSAPRRLRQLVPGDEAERLLGKRYAFINVWKPLEYPVEERPLTLCDARTLNDEDFVRTALRYRDRTGEIYTFRYNPEQRWFYYPVMQTDEVLLLKCYDSEIDGRARFVPHTSFEDPRSPANARPRKSVEVRTVAFFD